MKEYQVRISYTEVGVAFVMADNDDDAISKAIEQFNNGKVETSSENIDCDIEWVEDDECEM